MMIEHGELNNYMDGDEDIIKEFLKEFQNQYSSFCTDITEHVQKKQWQDTFMLLHALRGAASIFCRGEMIALLERLESEANDQKPVANQDIEALKEYFLSLNKEISAYINP